MSKLPLFSVKCHQSKRKSEITALKEERSQIMHLMLLRQSGRDIGEDIFACENSEWPPTLSSAGHMHKGTKSEIVKCLESEVEFSTAPPIVDVLILDGAFIVHMLKPGIMSTFKEYADQIFIPYILACLQNVSRLDVVWDIYKPDSLKFDTRQNRGDGVRQHYRPEFQATGMLFCVWMQISLNCFLS